MMTQNRIGNTITIGIARLGETAASTRRVVLDFGHERGGLAGRLLWLVDIQLIATLCHPRHTPDKYI